GGRRADLPSGSTVQMSVKRELSEIRCPFGDQRGPYGERRGVSMRRKPVPDASTRYRLRPLRSCGQPSPVSHKLPLPSNGEGSCGAADPEIASPAPRTSVTRSRLIALVLTGGIWNSLGDHAVDLEDLGVLPVDVHAVGAREVPDVLRIGVAPVLLRLVARERRDLALEVTPLERHIGLVPEIEVVPGDLVA